MPENKNTSDKKISENHLELDRYGLKNETPYGWCGFTPVWLQCFNSIGWLTFAISLFAFFKTFGFDGSVPTIVTTLENRFNLSSKQSGLMFSVFNIAFMIAVIPVAYFTRNISKPIVLGLSMMLLSASTLLFAMPHFLSDPYEPYSSDDEDLAICNISRVDSCDGGQTDEESGSKYYPVFLLSTALTGIATTPLMTTGFAHLESQARMRSGPLLFSLISTGLTAGIFCGGVLTAVMLGKIYIDFNRESDKEVNPADPNWLGAWWLPFLITSGFSLICSLPLFGFPKQLAGVASIKMEESQKETTEINELKETTELKKLFLLEKDIWTNPVIISILCAEVLESIQASGTESFGLKNIEEQFYLSPAEAGIFSSISGTVGAVLGILGNGVIIRIGKLNVRQCCYLYLTQAVVGFVIFFGRFKIRCENRPLDGLVNEHRQIINPPNLSNNFNAPCNCQEDVFLPYCVEHFSPNGTVVSNTTYFSVSTPITEVVSNQQKIFWLSLV